MEKLTGTDYMIRPYLELVSHPDFSQEAWNVIVMIAKMNNEQLENIKLIGGIINE